MSKPTKTKKKHAGWTTTNIESTAIIEKEKQIVKLTYEPLTNMLTKYQVNINQQLGHGFASVVHQAINIHNKQLCCVKIVDYSKLPAGKYRQLLHNEINILKKIKSEFVITLYDVYESQNFCYIVMQFCSKGDLYKNLQNTPQLWTINKVIGYIIQICKGVQQLQSLHLIHRDLKTQNLLLINDQQLKIGDFGFCINIQELDGMNVGSPIYMSPEVLMKQDYSYKSDIYAIGVIWYQLLHKDIPWKANTQAEILDLKINQQITFARYDIPQNHQKIIQLCLHYDPKIRPTIDSIISEINDFMIDKNSFQQ